MCDELTLLHGTFKLYIEFKVQIETRFYFSLRICLAQYHINTELRFRILQFKVLLYIDIRKKV